MACGICVLALCVVSLYPVELTRLLWVKSTLDVIINGFKVTLISNWVRGKNSEDFLVEERDQQTKCLLAIVSHEVSGTSVGKHCDFRLPVS